MRHAHALTAHTANSAVAPGAAAVATIDSTNAQEKPPQSCRRHDSKAYLCVCALLRQKSRTATAADALLVYLHFAVGPDARKGLLYANLAASNTSQATTVNLLTGGL